MQLWVLLRPCLAANHSISQVADSTIMHLASSPPFTHLACVSQPFAISLLCRKATWVSSRL